ncbi:hypothetical protein F5Y18DRAFT_7139 [Xylariaceae sp. FL1019]|nr:hypothetical protein F5Y18DRAFT_7139 [Xylariaceae sp. FL1019]
MYPVPAHVSVAIPIALISAVIIIRTVAGRAKIASMPMITISPIVGLRGIQPSLASASCPSIQGSKIVVWGSIGHFNVLRSKDVCLRTLGMFSCAGAGRCVYAKAGVLNVLWERCMYTWKTLVLAFYT